MTEEDDFVRRARARVGTTLKGKWSVDALLGVGGMAAVYAVSHRNGSRMAVKWLHPELALDQTMRDRFVREGHIANKVNHPGVVKILDDDEADDGSLLLFMELLEGETVDARWRRADKRLDVTETLSITQALLEVLVPAHEAGVVHRDLKPENLFLVKDGTLKVLDFGIARLRELSKGASGATGSQSSLGTPGFMPPEQARGRWEHVDARSDLWAVGATMFTLVAGRHVHEAVTVNEQLLAAMTAPAPPVASIVPSIPAVVAAVIDKALAFESDARWQTASAMLEACARAASAAAEPVTTVMPPRSFASVSPRRVRPLVVVALLSAAAVAGVGLLALRHRTPIEPSSESPPPSAPVAEETAPIDLDPPAPAADESAVPVPSSTPTTKRTRPGHVHPSPSPRHHTEPSAAPPPPPSATDDMLERRH